MREILIFSTPEVIVATLKAIGMLNEDVTIILRGAIELRFFIETIRKKPGDYW